MPESKVINDPNKNRCEPFLEVDEKRPELFNITEDKFSDEVKIEEVKDETHLSHRAQDSILFKILPVRLYGNNDNVVETFAMLDSGSSLTLIDSEVFEKLELDGEAQELTLQWTKGIERRESAVQTSITLSGAKGRKHILKKVYSIENLELPEQNVNACEMKERYKHLRGLPIKDLVKAKPKILIGLEHSRFLCCENPRQGNENEPIASKTELGWIVFGKSAPSMRFASLGLHMIPPPTKKVHEAVKIDNE